MASPRPSHSLSSSSAGPSPSSLPRASPSLAPSPQNVNKGSRPKRRRRKESFYQVQKLPGEQPSGAIPLENAWTIWVDGGSSVGMQQQEYQQRIIPIGSFDNIQVIFFQIILYSVMIILVSFHFQDFWRYWNNMEIDKFCLNSNLRLFKRGISPLWEDKANEKGGQMGSRRIF